MPHSSSTGHLIAKRDVLTVIAVAVIAAAVVAGQRRRISTLEKEVKRQEALRDSEHSGRVNAEKVCVVFTMRLSSSAAGGLKLDF